MTRGTSQKIAVELSATKALCGHVTDVQQLVVGWNIRKVKEHWG